LRPPFHAQFLRIGSKIRPDKGIPLQQFVGGILRPVVNQECPYQFFTDAVTCPLILSSCAIAASFSTQNYGLNDKDFFLYRIAGYFS
jgi:hypothetical protein